MATLTSPSPATTSASSEGRYHGSLICRPSLPTRAVTEKSPRERLILPQIAGDSARLRDAPSSPVRVNVQQENWPRPSNANIELAHPAPLRNASTQHAPSPLSAIWDDVALGVTRDANGKLAAETGRGSSTRPRSMDTFESSLAAMTEIGLKDVFSDCSQYPATDPSSLRHHAGDGRETKPLPKTLAKRGSTESALLTSSDPQPHSSEPSERASASSVSGTLESSEGPLDGDSTGSSAGEEKQAQNQYTRQFQYHHQRDRPPPPPSTTSNTRTRSPLSQELLENNKIRRHLTPNSAYVRRSSAPRPQSYSTLSDNGSRGRSSSVFPGSGHLRAPSMQSCRSPEARASTYAEFLNVPYPQQVPAPLALDNSDLRNVVGNNASLLSTQKTLEMCQMDVKKTNDFSVQYSFAVFLISTAMEQGLDLADPKASKPSLQQQPKDPDGAAPEDPAAAATVSNPHDLVREARQILQRLANGGYPFAQYYLADGYASGLFSKGKPDYNAAFPLFVLAAKHGHAESAYRTALCYEFGWGCRKDPSKAVLFLRSAASKRHPGAMIRLGKACLSGDLGEKKYREGIKWMKLAAEAADSQYNAASYQLGCLYETGYGDDVFRDPAYAANLFTQVADLGHPEAGFHMGEAYEHGLLGCPRDPALSVHFYTCAALRRHASAMMGLCAWYMVGAPPLLDKDEEEAYAWARKSADLGHLKAQYAVGYFTEVGIGCRGDTLEANVWYVKAAEDGDERARQRLAIIEAAVSGHGKPMEVVPLCSKKLAKDVKEDKECVM